MKSLSIKARLYMITAIIALVLLALGSVGIYALSSVNDKAVEISEVWLHRVKMADDINTMTSDYRLLQFNYVLAVAPADKSERTKDMEKLGAQIETSFKTYEQIAHPSRKELIHSAAEEWKAYLADSERIVTPLSAQGKMAEAGAEMRNAIKVKYDSVSAKIVEAADGSLTGAKNAELEASAIYASVSKWLIGIILVSLLITLVAMITVTKRISNGMNALLSATERMADGDLQSTMTVTNDDEFGRLGEATNKMSLNLKNLLEQIQKNSEQLAASSEQLTASADQSADVTQTIAQSVGTVAEMSNAQVTTVDNASSIIEQMSAAIEETAATIGVAAEQTSKAVDTAKEGNAAIESAIGQMSNIESTVNKSATVVEKLGERSKEIGQIVDTIAGIAGQTNLLALNAAIEAARAGEQGKGFAVVAEEVRKLAEQSQEAAKQIGDLIGGIQHDTEQAVVAMQEGTKEVKIGANVVSSAGEAFMKILGMVDEVNKQSNDIAATMEELASGTQQIVNSVQDIDRAGKQVAAESQSVSAATEQQSAAMEEIASASRNLSGLAEQMQQATRKFQL